MESIMLALFWALAAIVVRYLITQPHHVRALLNIYGFFCFVQSVIYYSDAADIEMSSSAVVVFTFILFFATVTHSPLSWLSLILYADPSKLPVSEIPRPISEWFSRPRQLIPPDSRSQAPDAINSEANKSQCIKILQEQLNDAKSIIKTYMRYVTMYEESQNKVRELENEAEALKADVKAREEDAVYARAERDLFKKASASDKARADKCDTIILGLMEKRDQRIHSRVCRWCKPKINRLMRDIKDMGKKLGDAAGAHNDLVESSAEAERTKDKIIDEMDKIIADKDKVIAEKDTIIADKDTIIADKDKIISARGKEALAQTASADLGDSSQASLFAHIGAVDLKLRDKDSEIARLNGYIDARRFCCCGGCGGASPGGPNDDGGDGGNTNGGPPQGGDAQPPTAANEPSGAPPCPVGEPSTPPPTTGAPSCGDDAAAGPVPNLPTTPVSSPLSSVPASPASVPEALVPLPASPVLVPESPAPIPATLVPLPTSPTSVPASPVPVPEALVPLPVSPVPVPTSPAPLPEALVPLPTSPVASPAPLVFAPAAAGFGPPSSTFVPAPSANGTSGLQPPSHGT
ncbi:hypothetical protein INS49_007312 [Diaporthe citri]|uniref:uncharacterized protein n=1 Tax=Diaporthe citri TaxID=83186 RepID=UPI001C7EB8E9|nr:uncharacterized protein INS49_007312 [Diaporthe citri]KAG6365701.1 hypothetical protein INS49_007312 [Diaporthe citri]